MPDILETEEKETTNDDLNMIEDISEDENDFESGAQDMQEEMFPEIGNSYAIEDIKAIANDYSELIQDFSECEPLEDQKAKNEEEMQLAEPYNLQDFYTFVGNNDNENVDTGLEETKNERKCNNQASKMKENKKGFDVKEDQSKLILMEYEQKEVESYICFDSGEKPNECTFCQKRFTKPSSLKIHKKSHSGEKPFKCKSCEKSFTRSYLLQQHERTHTGEKPYECKYCKRCLSGVTALKNHERIHTGEKPHQCKYCKECFSRLSILKEHERVHTGEVPFECLDCGKSFKYASNLSVHKKIHKDLK